MEQPEVQILDEKEEKARKKKEKEKEKKKEKAKKDKEKEKEGGKDGKKKNKVFLLNFYSRRFLIFQQAELIKELLRRKQEQEEEEKRAREEEERRLAELERQKEEQVWYLYGNFLNVVSCLQGIGIFIKVWKKNEKDSNLPVWTR